MLCAFDSVEAAAATVSGIIAAGVLPAALEMMDARITQAVEDFVGAGLPTRRAGGAARRGRRARRAASRSTSTRSSTVARANGATLVRVAADDAERALLWKGRKSAFGAIARIAPDYYLHDAVVPRTKLVEVLRRVYEIADAHDLIVMNVFHAGDGNLHPLLVFDRREPGVWERVYAAGTEILDACLDAGGVLTGEHGVGIEKRDLMPRMFSADDLDAQARLRDAFDPDGVANPQKVLPRGSRCGELQRVPGGNVDMTAAATPGPVRHAGRRRARTGRSAGRRPRARSRCARPRASSRYEPADMTITVGAGTTFDELDRVLAEHGQECALDPRSRAATIGGILACGLSGVAPAAARPGPRPRARGALRDRRRPAGEGRRPDRQERHRLRPPAPVRRFARHDRRAAAGDAALPAARRVRALVHRAPRRRRAYRPSARLWNGDREARAARRASPPTSTAQGRGLAPLDARARAARRPAPRPHLGRARTRARRARRALARRRALVRGARRRHDPRRGRRRPTRSRHARAVAHAHGGWMLREAGGAPDDDGYGRPLPERRR